MHRQATGYLAKYQASPDEVQVYVDQLWEKFGEFSVIERAEASGEGRPLDPEEFRQIFGDLGWEFPTHAVVHEGPTVSAGGGANYYVDPAAGLVFQRTVFW